MGEEAVARTVIAPIKRQEPGHYAFYQLSARLHWSRLARWQRWLVRQMRTISFAPVGANSPQQLAQFGELMDTLRITPALDDFAIRVSMVERELLWADGQGLKVPPYVVRAFRHAVDQAVANRQAA